MDSRARKLMELDIAKHKLLITIGGIDNFITHYSTMVIPDDKKPVQDFHSHATIQDRQAREMIEGWKIEKEETMKKLEDVYSKLFAFIKEECQSCLKEGTK